jgi:hypothetical protein
MEKVIYKGIYPIGNSNPLDMPVRDIDAAAAWYETNMGFVVEGRDETARTVQIKRDSVVIQLAENRRNPEAESCYIEVSDVETARAELASKGLNLSLLRDDNYGGQTYRVFFVKDEDGLCYCVGTKAST